MPKVRILRRFEGEAVAKLEKMAKRAAKYGQRIEWSVAYHEEEQRVVRPDGRPVKRMVAYADIDVVGELPKVGDFRLIAELELDGGQVFIAGGEVGPLGREWNGRCDHCGANRARKLGYVVEGADGGRLVVGKACLADYVREGVPADLLWRFQWERDLAAWGDDEEAGGWGGGGRYLDHPEAVVALARAAIALWGYRPAAFAESSVQAVALALGWAGADRDWKRKIRADLLAELAARADHYCEAADKVMAWAADMEPRNDYEHNLKAALALPYVDPKRLGLAVSAAVAYDNNVRALEEKARRELEREAKQAERAKALPSFHIGKVGERLKGQRVKLEAKMVMPDRGYGESILLVMRRDDGAVVKWFASNPPRVEVGDEFVADFSIKRHAMYKDVRENIVLRLKVVEGV